MEKIIKNIARKLNLHLYIKIAAVFLRIVSYKNIFHLNQNPAYILICQI